MDVTGIENLSWTCNVMYRYAYSSGNHISGMANRRKG